MRKLLLVLTFFSFSTLFGMDYNTPAQLTWANPQATQDTAQFHPKITGAQRIVLFTAQGVEIARKHLERRPASASNFEGLDLADNTKPRQYALKLTALLNAKRNEDPRGFMLQETMCTPHVLKNWRTTLPQEPSLFREGWDPTHDKEFAQAMLIASKLPTQLKNLYLTSKDKKREVCAEMQRVCFSPDGRYAAGTNAKGDGVVIDMATQKIIHRAAMLYPHERATFSADNRLCILPLAEFEERNGHRWSHEPHKTTLQAFDLTTNTVVTIPKDCTTQQEFPVVAFSRSGRYAVLKPKTASSSYIGIFDTQTQETVVKFPETKYWYSTASISPDEKYCFIPTKDGLKLYNLEKDGQECREFPLSACGGILWAPNSACSLVQKELSQHTSQYHVYYPQDNSYMTLDTAHHNYAPCFSPDGRYCYVLHENHIGRIYDFQERKTIKTFEFVRVIDCEAPPAFFSEDPAYPYCIVPHIHNNGTGKPTHRDLRVGVFNLQTHELVVIPSNLESVMYAEWPQRGPYYYVVYHHEPPPNYRSNIYSSVEIRDKKTDAVVLHVNNGRFVRSTADTCYVCIDDSNEGTMIVDMVNERVIEKAYDWHWLPDGRVMQSTHGKLYEIAPPDCHWSKITSQQLCFILYALHKCRKDAPIDLTKNDTKPLRVLFESLGEYMQGYVAQACNIKM